MSTICKSLEEFGYCKIPKFFNQNEMKILENFHEETLQFPSAQLGRVPEAKIHPDAFNHNVELGKFIMGNREVQAIFREIIGGDIAYLHHSDCHLNWSGGYHRDSIDKDSYLGFEPNNLFTPEANKNYKIYKMAIYLQADGEEVFRVLEGSHSKPGGKDKFMFSEKRLFSGYGDVIIFDTRIYHRGVLSSQVSSSQNRRAIFFTVGAINDYSERFSNGTVWRQNNTLKKKFYSLDSGFESFLKEQDIKIVPVAKEPAPESDKLVQNDLKLRAELANLKVENKRLQVRLNRMTPSHRFFKKFKLVQAFELVRSVAYRILPVIFKLLVNIPFPKVFDLLIISDGARTTGGPKPIDNYVKFAKAKKEIRVSILPPRRLRGLKSMLKILLSKKIILNGLKTLSSPELQFYDLKRINDRLYTYLHETEWVYRKVLRAHPEKADYINFILDNSYLLCVSSLQANYYRELGFSSPSSVIYNNVDAELFNYLGKDIACGKKVDASGKVKVVMVGTLQDRKGVNFFSEVADYLSRSDCHEGHNYELYWVGRQIEPDLYLSPHVFWVGDLYGEELYSFIAGCDIFFLASYDDPFPLVVLEAVALRRRILVYRGVGSAEFVPDLDSALCFEKHEPEEVYKKLEVLRHLKVNENQTSNVLQRYCSIESFSDRLEEALEL